jgi:Tfp pilus assembly protein PilX
MRRSRGQLLLGGLVCLVIATILVIVLFEPTLAQYAR